MPMKPQAGTRPALGSGVPCADRQLYYVAGRGREWIDNVLDGLSGWLMSDGWIAYRHYPRRLRCWAHLLRKARGWLRAVIGTPDALVSRS
ncbi:MAG: transposase [Candidatus Competibacteraceae bacterium]|nr:transposase [Candidatus Competibacteraceae bacterium]